MGAVAVFERSGNRIDLHGVTRFVGEIVESAAKSVKLRGGSTALRRKEFSGEMETFSGAGENLFWGRAAQWNERI